MWLLNTGTLRLEHFLDDRWATYAIVSHCWTDNEVSFSDIQNFTDDDSIPRYTPGWRKIRSACSLAQRDGLQYLWIDTCGIDKSSSAELSEAINSMYRWYQNARICYAYLHDVMEEAQLAKSKWFRRGWTLQELIAPRELLFYDFEWRYLGSREEHKAAIERVTGIPSSLLLKATSVDAFSIAQRMSWASARETTRAEDMAYSLMGLFGVNMPMLYGEGGERAFLRLQEEIIKYSTDQTIFAWKIGDDKAYRGLLAHSTVEFAGCGQIKRHDGSEDVTFQQTNAGLQISLRSQPYSLNVYLVELLAWEQDASIGIFLGFPPGTGLTNRVGRRRHTDKDRLPFSSRYPLQYAKKQFVIPRYPFLDSVPEATNQGLYIRSFTLSKNLAGLNDRRMKIFTREFGWDPATSVVSLWDSTVGCVVAFALPVTPFALKEDSTTWWVFMKLGFTAQFEPWVWIYPSGKKSAPLNLATLIDKGSKAKLGGGIQFRTRLYDTSLSQSPEKSAYDECGTTQEQVLASAKNVTRDTMNYHVGTRATGLTVNFEGVLVKVQLLGTPRLWTVDVKPTPTHEVRTSIE